MINNETIEKNTIHRKLYEKYKVGVLPTPKILWHESELEIDLSLQRDTLNPKLLLDGFAIIPNVDIEVLLNNMTVQDAEMFRKKDLYNLSFDGRTTSTVLNFWLANNKLIPPTIVVFDKECIDTLGINAIPSKELSPVDGKHRMNVSYFFGVKSIPILVRTKQVELITSILYPNVE
jgi:hypothetical protein